jgi:hypothetical protein
MSKVRHFTPEQVELLVAATKAQTQATKAIEKAQGKREGAYAVSTRLAVEIGADFEPAMEHLFSQIRTNEDKLASRFSAPKNDKGDGFKIPSSLSSAKSVLAGAIEYGIELVDEEDGETPRPFGQIRKDLKAAKQALEDAERSDAEVSRDRAADMLVAFAATLRTHEVDAAMGEWCEGISEVLEEWGTELAALMGDAGDEEEGEVGDAEVEAAIAQILAEEEAA